jgi:hypothetical protein
MSYFGYETDANDEVDDFNGKLILNFIRKYFTKMILICSQNKKI